MSIECAAATEGYLKSLSAGFHCSPVGGRLRVVTPYPYPDNDLIEVFVEDGDDGRVRVSDLGETLRHLRDLGMDVAASRSRREMVNTIAEGRAVAVHRGQLFKEGPTHAVGELIFDVLVAARAVSDLVLTLRIYQQATFKEEVAALLHERRLEFESDVPVVGQSGRTYKVDFRVLGSGRFVETVSPASAGALQRSVSQVFRVWSDVDGSADNGDKVTLLNDLDFRWREPDVALLRRVSNVQFWTNRDELADVLSIVPVRKPA